MGTVNWCVTTYGRQKGAGAASLSSTEVIASGTFTSSTSNQAITGLDLKQGQVLLATVSEDMWINFGGNAAAVGTGRPASATFPIWVECTNPGVVSVIDVA